MRGKITVPADVTQEYIETNALADPKVLSFLDGKNVRRVVYVPRRLSQHCRGGLNDAILFLAVALRPVWLFAMMTVAPLGGCGYQFVGESSAIAQKRLGRSTSSRSSIAAAMSA